MLELRRKLYKRGSSYETTIPMPLLFSLEDGRRYDVVFCFDSKSQKWYIGFEENNRKNKKKRDANEKP